MLGALQTAFSAFSVCEALQQRRTRIRSFYGFTIGREWIEKSDILCSVGCV